MEEAASSSRRMDELALSCPASAISTCNLTNPPFIIKLLKESDHSFRHGATGEIATGIIVDYSDDHGRLFNMLYAYLKYRKSIS